MMRRPNLKAPAALAGVEVDEETRLFEESINPQLRIIRKQMRDLVLTKKLVRAGDVDWAQWEMLAAKALVLLHCKYLMDSEANLKIFKELKIIAKAAGIKRPSEWTKERLERERRKHKEQQVG